MSLPNQYILSNLSEVLIITDTERIDVSPYINNISITESLFSCFIQGSIEITDTPSTRVLRNSNIKGGPDTKISFSFSGVEGKEKTAQSEIKIAEEEYRVVEISSASTSGREGSMIIHFIHKSFYNNEQKKISKHFSQKKVSSIVESLGKIIELNWEEIEPTHNNITTTLPYNNCIDHISFMTKYACRKTNINDVNYLFWQNLKGKHNFVSLGKLYSEKPSFGTDINSGFIFGNYLGNNYDINRRLVSEHKFVGSSTTENMLGGLFSSSMIFVDRFNTTASNAIKYDLREEWEKQTHLSSNNIIENNSSFWDNVGPGALTRLYHTSRHSYCCKEKEGGQRNEIFCAPRRLSQLAQLFQLGIEFKVSGNSNLDEISAGKIIYFGRPLNYESQNPAQEDIFYSGKFLITNITHMIHRNRSGIFEYSCNIKSYKDSIGEE